MKKTTFHISKMDCASEEQMIRMKLQGDPAIRNLVFDIPGRKLHVFHEGSPRMFSASLNELNLASTLIESIDVRDDVIPETSETQRKLLWIVLLINLGCFILEVTTGFFSGSMGLVADSLDMLADTLGYGLALVAVGGTAARKKNIAKAAGYFQSTLALLGFAEVIRRFLGYDTAPVFST